MRRRDIPLIPATLMLLVTACSPVTDAAPASSNGQEGTAAAGTAAPVADSFSMAALSAISTDEPVRVEPTMSGGDACIPLAVATTGTHFYFEVPSDTGVMQFIGYRTETDFEIRSALCPACNEGVVELASGDLHCAQCGARFDTATGNALSATRGYPQGSISVCVYDGYVRSPLHSLSVAYERTATGEELLYRGPDVQFPIPCGGC